MSQKIYSLIIILSCLIALSPARADEKDYEAEINVGAQITDANKETSRVAEYSSAINNQRNWYLRGKVNYFGKIYLNMQGQYLNVDEQNYKGTIDLNRILIFHTDYERFYHRLDHDHLKNLEAHSMAALKTVTKNSTTKWVTSDVAGAGLATVYHTDFNPSEHYGITRSTWKNSLTMHVPFLPHTTIEILHRYESRKGLEQARTLSKCAACHVVAKNKFIDEFTNDYNPKVRTRLGSLHLEYSYLYRNFYNSNSTPTNIYNEAQRPVSGDGTLVKPGPGLLLFDAELQFDASDGPLPFSRTPEIRKRAHTLKAKYDFSQTNQVYLGFVKADIANKSTNEGANELYGNFGQELDLNYAALMGWWHYRLKKGLTLTIRGKYSTMDADDVFLDVRELRLPDNYPIHPGKTYREAIGCTCDIVRFSAYNIEEYKLQTDLAWRVIYPLKLKFGYEFDYKNRENAGEFLGYPPVNKSTTKHIFKIGSYYRLTRSLKLNLNYKLNLTHHPYTHLNAFCPQQAPDFDNDINDDGWADIWAPTNWYSKYVYHTRDQNMSIEPDLAHDIRLKIDWLPPKSFSLQGNVHYIWAENDELEAYTYRHRFFNTGLNLTWSALSRVGVNAGYQYYWDKHEAMFCSAFYHG